MAARRPSPAEQQRRQDAAEARLQASQQRIVDGVAALVTGDDWAAYLRFAARFHSYSFNNTVLIMTQAPAATYVAGYQTWLSLGRQVRKGETGIAILAPVLARRADEPGPATDPGGGATRRPVDGPELAGRRIVGVRNATIFDVSQTDPVTAGSELPLIRPVLLEGDAQPQLWTAFEALVRDRGFTVERGPCGDANGLTHFGNRTVRVRGDVSGLQAVKTLAHELGHVLLHDPTTTEGHTTDPVPDCRGLVEIEAESVACMTLSSQGLDSSDYTFPYVALWASNGRSADPTAIAAAIQTTANRVIAATRTITTSLTTKPDSDPTSAGPAELNAVRKRATTGLEQLQTVGVDEHPPTPAAATTGAAPAVADAAAAAAQRTVSDPRRRLYAVNAVAMTYFTDFKRRDIAADYLRGRGITPPAEYRVGYAPVGGGLSDYLTARGFTADQQIAAGVVRRDQAGRLRDVFRDRIVVPVLDATGICGFVGRAHRDDRGAPRYLNTAATPIFDKAALLYGYTERLPQLRDGAVPVLVEGFIDVLAVAQHAPRHVPIAVMGTAFTHHHAHLLTQAQPAPASNPDPDGKPTADRGPGRRLLEALDADDAGRTAAVTVVETLLPQGWHIRTPQLIPGADPADIAQQHGDKILDWLAPGRCRNSLNVVVDHKIAAWGQLQWPEQRVAAYHHVRDYLAEHFPDHDTAAALDRAADLTGIPRPSVTTATAATAAAAATAGPTSQPQPPPPRPAPPRSWWRRTLQL